MAGVPPMLGFVGKEAAFTALLEGGLPDRTAGAWCSPAWSPARC